MTETDGDALSDVSPIEAPAVRVVYVGGEGRSGSTVLEAALAAHPDVVAVGELKYLWKWGVRNSDFCACEQPVPECEFWSAVGRRLFGSAGFASDEAARLFTDYESVASNRRMFAAFITPLLPESRRRLVRVRSLLRDLYQAIADESGALVVLDSSKHPMHLGLIKQAPGLDLSVVQLVRNPCGVAYSWSKRVPLPHDPTGQRTMGPHPAPVVVARWGLINLAVHYVRRQHGGMLIRYEDLCRDSKPTIARILSDVGLDPTLVPTTEGAAIATNAGHGIAGNPSRFNVGSLTVTEDNRWREHFSLRKQALIKASVFPLALLYRYIERPRTSAAMPSAL